MGLMDWLIDLQWGKGDARLKNPGECVGIWSRCYSCEQVGKTKLGQVFAVIAATPYRQKFAQAFRPMWHCARCVGVGRANEQEIDYVGQIDAEKRAWTHAMHHGGR